jgi:hypothetical protein
MIRQLLPLAHGPCASCSAFLDQLDGAAGHAAQHINQPAQLHSPTWLPSGSVKTANRP